MKAMRYESVQGLVKRKPDDLEEERGEKERREEGGAALLEERSLQRGMRVGRLTCRV